MLFRVNIFMVTLGTDTLIETFGEIRTDVLSQSIRTRAVRHRNADRIVAYAFVEFKEGVSAFPAVHNEIQAGSHIGETFRKRSVPYSRDETSVFEYFMPPKLRRLFEVEDDKCFVKQVDVFVGPERAHYASVIEVYSPPVRFDRVYGDADTLKRIRRFLDLQFIE